MKQSIILTCEHASNAIPEEYQALFAVETTLLQTHAAYDIGAAQVFDVLKNSLASDGVKGEWSRLLIDLNRSLDQPDVFSTLTAALSQTDKQMIIDEFYQPYRHQVLALIQSILTKNMCVCHLSIHSFTPELAGIVRDADIGLLYDPKRPSEARFCAGLQAALCSVQPQWQVRLNYPYEGSSDGLTTSLRQLFPDERYLGIEVEINQKHLLNPDDGVRVAKQLLEALVHQQSVD